MVGQIELVADVPTDQAHIVDAFGQFANQSNLHGAGKFRDDTYGSRDEGTQPFRV